MREVAKGAARARGTFRAIWVVGVLAVSWCATGAEYKPKWETLFNGRNLHGWEPRGQAKWTVENGVLIGQQNDGKVGDLFTVRQWSDFELSVTYKVQWPANTGIWFRKPAKGLGYQMDILEKARYGCASGSIWSRGFLSRNLDESIEKRDDWNTAVIRAEGENIVVTLNGKKIADIADSQYVNGKIGFQVHAGDRYKNMKIMIKEAKILPLRASEAGVSNAICLVCHLDFGQEPLAAKHLLRNVGCANCHGESMPHAEDEEHLTKPDRAFKRNQVDGFCGLCHSRSRKPCKRKRSKTDQGKICTDCHGQHRIKDKPRKPVAKRPAASVARPKLVPMPATDTEVEAAFRSPPKSCYPDLSGSFPLDTTPAQVFLASARQLAEGRLPVKLTANDVVADASKPGQAVPLDRQPYAPLLPGLPKTIARATYLSAIGKPVAEGKGKESFVLYPPDEEVIYLHLRNGKRELYLATNQSSQPYSGHVTFRSQGRPEVWDPATGEIRPAHGVQRTDDGTVLSLRLPPQSCQFFVFRRPLSSPSIRRAPGLTGVIAASGKGRLDVTARAWMNGRYTVTLDDGRKAKASVAGLPPALHLDGSWEFSTTKPYGREPSLISTFRAAEAKGLQGAGGADFDDSSWDTVKPGQALAFLLPKWDAYWLTFKGDGAKRYFRKTFTLNAEVKKATLSVSVDNIYELYVNGEPIGKDRRWEKAETYDVTSKLKRGKNIIAVLAQNQGGIAAALAQAKITLASGKTLTIVTDGTWKMASKIPAEGKAAKKPGWTAVDLDDAKWGKPTVFKKPPVRPWRYVPGLPSAPRTGARVWYRFDLLPGTAKVELPRGLPTSEVWIGGQRMTAQDGVVDLSKLPKERRTKAAMLVDSGKPLPGPVKCHCAEGGIALGSWTTQGYSRYAGAATYTRRFVLPKEYGRAKLMLDLGDVSAAARVRVNGKPAGERAWLPYTFDLGDALRAGENEISVTVFSTLAKGGSAPAGLIGPVRLAPYRDVQFTFARKAR